MLFSIRVCQSLMKLKKLFTPTHRSTPKSTTVLYRSAHSALWISTAPHPDPECSELEALIFFPITWPIKSSEKTKADKILRPRDVNLAPLGHAANKKVVLIFKENFDPCMLGGDIRRGRAMQIPERNTEKEKMQYAVMSSKSFCWSFLSVPASFCSADFTLVALRSKVVN